MERFTGGNDMTVAIINMRASNGGPPNWNDIVTNTSPINLVSVLDGSSTGWTAAYDPGPNDVINAIGSNLAGTGDANWYLPAAADGHANSSTSVWTNVKIAVPDGTYNIRGFSSAPHSGRITAWRVNGGTIQTLDNSNGTGPQNSNDVRFLGVSPSAGIIEVEYRKADSSSGQAYVNAIYIEDVPSPTVTTTDTLQPGESFTLTATNYASAPVSPATFTDSEGSTITVPVTISGSGPYTAVGTMPTLAEAVTAGTSLLFGDVTIELST